MNYSFVCWRKKEYKLEEILSINRDMPDKKYDINNNGPFSTDLIGMNHSLYRRQSGRT